MVLRLSNNSTSILAASIDASQTTITVLSDDAGLFPALSAGQWFPITVIDALGNIEIMHCSARSSATLTVVRGREGTTARAFAAGSRVDVRLTAAAADAFMQLGLLSANVQSILGAANFAAVRALLQQEGARIRQIKHLVSGTNGSTSTNTSYGGTLGSGQSVTPVSNTSKLLVLGFGSMVVTRAATGLFGSARLHRYNGSAWVASSEGSLPVVVGENLGGTTTTDIRAGVTAIATFPQADINAGTGNWQIVFAGNVSTTGSSPLMDLNNISYLMIELEGL